MQTEIGSYDAKTKLPEILRRVEAGESFIITNRGRPVAELVPCRTSAQDVKVAAINSIMEAKKFYVSDQDLLNLKEFGRK